MILRDLGKTGLRVGEIGLGAEHLGRTNKARQVIVEVVDKAVESGINYFDLIFNFKEYIENYEARAAKPEKAGINIDFSESY